MNRLASINVPQANRPEAIRALVGAVSAGFRSTEDLAREAELSSRHVGYYLQAARILGYVALKPDLKPLPMGERLLAAAAGSAEEAHIFRDAIVGNNILLEVAGDFLATDIDKSTLAQRLQDGADLSPSTADSRAATLINWREYIAERLQASPAAAPLPSLISTAPTRTTVDPPTPPGAASAPPWSFCLNDTSGKLLEGQLQKARILLMTGSGFSSGAVDTIGRPLPIGPALARELWNIAFVDREYEEGSILGDIYAVALQRNRPALQRFLATRLTVDPGRLPEYYRTWFSMPWRKVYTLNQDNLDLAVATRFGLPRTLVPVSAAPGSAYNSDTGARDGLRIIHLNGLLADGVDKITFSPPQYGRRHADQDAAYTELATDLLAYTFIFVGTPLDEEMLWHHVELREARLSKEAKEYRPRSFLVTPFLALARQGLLEQYKITWVQATAEQFEREFLSKIATAATAGHAALRREFESNSDLRTNIRPVSEYVADCSDQRTDYLFGAHPTWSDLVHGRAASRADDQIVLDRCHQEIRERQPRDPARILILSGTGGAGKSTALMRAALVLSAEGENVGWVGVDTEVSPKTLSDVASDGTFTVIAIDDLDRYGLALPSLVSRLSTAPLKLVIATLRASKVHVARGALEDGRISEHAIPHLTDGDIDSLLDVLDKEHRLGTLTGLSRDAQRAKFREQAGRQLLVAMIQATSNERFEEKVFREWSELPPDDQIAYSMIAVSAAFGSGLTKTEVLLACGGGLRAVAALSSLVDRKIIILDTNSSLYRARHRVIAETLVDEMRRDGRDIAGVLKDLCFAISSGASPDMPPSARPRRLLKALLNHRYVFINTDTEAGRRIYEAVEPNLHWDHHFWLQRGNFELQEGSLDFAEHCLNTARALDDDDPYVDTAFAHVLFRKAVANPTAAAAEEWVAAACDILKGQIEARGDRDYYPYHVLGSQAIAWAGKAPWPKDKCRFFLEDVNRRVRNGIAAFPKSEELQDVARGLQSALLALQLAR